MKILVIGGGGREHAICKKIAESKHVSKLYCAPGNAGIAKIAECVPIGVMEFDKMADYAAAEGIDLCVVGPDDPLVGGIVDVLQAKGLRVFGPQAKAAILEGSKVFSKDLMKKYNIPTGAYETFDNAEAACEYLKTADMPIVLKADGLALGKGVLICNNLEEALQGVKTLMEDKQFGDAGNSIVVEEFLTGREVSVLSFVDGKTIKIMTSAQDHKRAKDNDEGLNTGGMGTFSPTPFYTAEVDEFCKKYVYQATVDAMAAEGREFKGIIFFGLILTPKGPRVLEFNARFGDPETQVVLPLLESDLLTVMQAVTEDMGYTNYGIFRAYIARLPSDQRENKAASKLLGKKVLGPCLIQFVSNEGVFQYLPKKYCQIFHKYLKTRLDCPMTYSYEYARILCPTL